MQDYARAIVVGSKSTFGKGTVQRFYDLDRVIRGNDAIKPLGELKLTMQKFYRIDGGATQLKGVEPDIVLPDRYSKIDIGERELDHPMPWTEIEPLEFGQDVDIYRLEGSASLQGLTIQLPDDVFWGSATELAVATDLLATEGGFEDGYDGIDVALNDLSFRPGAAVNVVLVTDEDRDLLPAWAGFAGAVIESGELVPTASRESLQKNDAYRQVQRLLHESLVAGLAAAWVALRKGNIPYVLVIAWAAFGISQKQVETPAVAGAALMLVLVALGLVALSTIPRQRAAD